MTDAETGRALWLSLGDPFRMGWVATGAGAVLLVSFLLPLAPETRAFASEYEALIGGGVFVAYWLFMAPGARRLLGLGPKRAMTPAALLTLGGTAAVLLAAEWIIQWAFDSLLWPSGFPLTGAAFHLTIIAVAFLKDACMVGAALGGTPRAAMLGPRRVLRGPNLVIAYALLFFAAFLLNPWGGPWIGHFLPPVSAAPLVSEIGRYLSLLASIHLTLSMTALVARGAAAGRADR